MKFMDKRAKHLNLANGFDLLLLGFTGFASLHGEQLKPDETSLHSYTHKVRKKDGAVALAVRRLFAFGDVAQARKGAKEMGRGLKSRHHSLGMHQGMIISSCHD